MVVRERQIVEESGEVLGREREDSGEQGKRKVRQMRQ